MRTAKIVLLTLLSAGILASFAAATAIYAGVFNVAATEPHWALTSWVLDTARVRSIRAHAAGLLPPPGYDDQVRLVPAVGHFAEHCATCHGGPGTKRSVVAEGMYPEPPDLKEAAQRYSAGELFWILKNGIKMSGMPSMASDGDEMLWATVALLRKLPEISDDEYNDLWMQAQATGDHGSMNHGTAATDGKKGADQPSTASQPDGGERHKHSH
ncbi:c-type cytochrome [Methylorubrum thiocyanatum]|uniref:c-type cytochrome n=1 Tax=Methylorubrum thiocyanatum TaxID=47958 RepID=UPI0035C8306A